MKKETRAVVYDEVLHLQAYRFAGIAEPFPNHFHEQYVLGLVESGQRALSCRGRDCLIGPGDVVLFNPGDNHGCTQRGEGAFDYRGFHIPEKTMLDLVEEITGKREPLGFSQNVLRDEEIVCYLRTLHEMVMAGGPEVGREETLLLLVSALIGKFSQSLESCVPECPEEIERACAFMRRYFDQRISLEQICRQAGLSKSTLLRSFTKAKGITPYRYLEAIRVNAAKALLEQGVPPAEAAQWTGFFDQSHFTNYFGSFIGLAPGAYREIFQKKDEKNGITE